MPESKRRFFLMCNITASHFVLTREEEDWRRQFSALEDALAFARNVATQEVRLTVYNEIGKAIIETFVSPIRES